MYLFRSLRAGTGLLAAVALALLMMILLSGCSDDDASPTAAGPSTAPTLPEAAQLTFDFSFFDAAEGLDKTAAGHANFINAYLRAVVLDASARLVLAAPVAAFAAAVNTMPTPADDGSWVWIYTWDHAGQRVGVLLRGRPDGQVVHWELSLLAKSDPTGVLWFSGTTTPVGHEGRWTFRDLETPDHPECGQINWGATSAGGRYLEFVSLDEHAYGDRLRFAEEPVESAITFQPGDGADECFIRWDATRAGSLRVPDYNGGQEACWDGDLLDVDCR